MFEPFRPLYKHGAERHDSDHSTHPFSHYPPSRTEANRVLVPTIVQSKPKGTKTTMNCTKMILYFLFAMLVIHADMAAGKSTLVIAHRRSPPSIFARKTSHERRTSKLARSSLEARRLRSSGTSAEAVAITFPAWHDAVREISMHHHVGVTDKTHEEEPRSQSIFYFPESLGV